MRCFLLNIKEEIKDYLYSINVDMVGITDSKPILKMEEILQIRYKNGLVTPFEGNIITERVNPCKILPETKSVIVLGISYYIKNSNENSNNKLYADLAKYSKVNDYHDLLKNKMKKCISFIEKKLSYLPKHCFLVDTNPLLERAFAVKAGLGISGNNTFVINKKYGTYFVLGEILIDLELEPDIHEEDVCLQCGKCIEACPTGALFSPFNINPNLCLSYWSQSKKDIPRKFRSLMKNNVVGCDVCQDVCPMNSNIMEGSEVNFKPIAELNSVSLLEILKMNNKEFKEKFGMSAVSWCGKRVLQRNALIALGNSGDISVVEEIIPFMNDMRPQIRKHAAWALGKLGGKKSIKVLKDFLKKEEDIDVVREIKESLNFNIKFNPDSKTK